MLYVRHVLPVVALTDALFDQIDAADPKPRYGEGELPTQPDPVVNRQRSYRPPVPLFDETNEQYNARIDQQHAPQAGPSNASGQLDRVSEMEEDAEMGGGPYASPPVETQLFECTVSPLFHSTPASTDALRPSDSQVGDEVDKRFSDDSTGPEPDTIKTISQPVDQPVAESSKGSKKTATKATARKQVDPPSSVGPQLRKRTRNRMKLGEEVCECGDKDEDGAMICCGSMFSSLPFSPPQPLICSSIRRVRDLEARCLLRLRFRQRRSHPGRLRLLPLPR